MPRSSLALWAHTPPSAAYPLLTAEYGEQIEALEVTTVAPGGFGDLTCLLKLPDARLPRPELQVFSRVCLRDGPFTVFGGEWSDPALVLDSTAGEHVLLSALGGGSALRDDPDDSAYSSASTAQAIIATEFAKRSAYLALDVDQSAVLPSAPANTSIPVYDGYTVEEILHDLTAALGEDILRWHVAPSAQRAYNVVQVAYVDPASGPGVVTVSDARLNGDGSQGNAPFRRRKLRRNLGKLPLTGAQAAAIANAWLATYSNPTNKVEVELRAVRDATGKPFPLHQVRADGNLYIPELAVRGQQLPTGPTPGVNQFSIAESLYRESSSDDVRLLLQLDNYADPAASLIARLQIADEARQRQRGVYRAVQSPGAQQVGYLSIRSPSVSAGGTLGVGVNFVPVLSKTPTGLSFRQIAATNVGSGPSVTVGTLTPYGCEVTATASATGAVVWTGKYTTVGA